MKKCLSRCRDYNSILTQASSGPTIIFYCSDCYNIKYLKEVQHENRYVKKE